MENTESLITVRERITEMSELVLSMLRRTFAGFIEHDLNKLKGVLKDENSLNDMERSITLSLVEASKGRISDAEKREFMQLAGIAADLEEIGDYVKDMIERIEIKIEERLLFSEEALSEYQHLYTVAETALNDVVNSLKMDDKDFARRITPDEGHIDRLIERYRNAHTQRLLSGVCDVRAGNMYLNLLDFMGQVFHHTKNIAKGILELK